MVLLSLQRPPDTLRGCFPQPAKPRHLFHAANQRCCTSQGSSDDVQLPMVASPGAGSNQCLHKQRQHLKGMHVTAVGALVEAESRSHRNTAFPPPWDVSPAPGSHHQTSLDFLTLAAKMLLVGCWAGAGHAAESSQPCSLHTGAPGPSPRQLHALRCAYHGLKSSRVKG